MIMVTAATTISGLTASKSAALLSSTYYYSDISDKFPFVQYDVGILPQQQTQYHAKKTSSTHNPGFGSNYRRKQAVKAVREHVDKSQAAPTSVEQSWFHDELESEEADFDDNLSPDCSVEALLLLQKSMLEKQLALHFEHTVGIGSSLPKENCCNGRNSVTSSGISARQRRVGNRRKNMSQTSLTPQPSSTSQKRVSNGYVKGNVREELLTHLEVVRLSNKIKTGLSIEAHKSRLQKRIGCVPSEEQLAISLKMSSAELRSINLVQGGLIGLLRGIEKFDSSKGCKISTYVYWWIRQGVSRALVETSRTLRLPAHLHERLSLIRNAKIRLEDKGITPTIDKIAETLNMSLKKVRNATEANNKVYSLDREVFPSLNGLPSETYHSYIGDTCLQNNPWNGVDERALKSEVTDLINSTLRERERDIIRLYYGLDNECLTWEEISKRMGLSRERVRQVGLVALEKLKNGARKKRMEAMLLKQ